MKSGNDDGRKRDEAAREILHYLASNPDAEDTLEGIARWWLERRRIELTINEVRDSVEMLLNRGLILASRQRLKAPCYRMNPAKQTEIAKLLERDDPHFLSGSSATDASSTA